MDKTNESVITSEASIFMFILLRGSGLYGTTNRNTIRKQSYLGQGSKPITSDLFIFVQLLVLVETSFIISALDGRENIFQ